MRILDVLNVREASPKELEGILDEKLHHVAYHVRVLNECHCLELRRTAQRRGATEHYYRAVPESSMGYEVLRDFPRALRGTAAVAALQAFAKSLMAALKAGAAKNDDELPLSSMTIALDDVGREDAISIVQDAITRLKGVDAESRRRAGPDKPLTPYVAGQAFFKAADQDGND